MNSDRVMGQLLALRGVLDNLIGELEDAQPKKIICLHPPEEREIRGSMGNVTGFKCRRCEQVVESPE